MGRALSCSGVLLSCQETFPSQRLLLVGWLGQGQGGWVRMGSEHRSWSCWDGQSAPTAALNSIPIQCQFIQIS